MKIINDLRRYAAKALLKSELKSLKRDPFAIGLNDASKIGILYDATEKENYDAVKNFVRRLRQEQKDVRSLGFINSKRFPSDQFVKLGMDFFTLSHVNWHYKPIAKVTENFRKEPFDILLCLNIDNSMPLEYLASTSEAKFKVGRFSDEKSFIYDFMIQLKPNQNILHFIQQMEHYLHLIQKKGVA